MAEIQSARKTGEKRVLLYENFESISHHAITDGTAGWNVQRSAEAAKEGHAGLLMQAPASANAYVLTRWKGLPGTERLIALSTWINWAGSSSQGAIEWRVNQRERAAMHDIFVRYETFTRKWYYLDEQGIFTELSAVTTELNPNEWYNIIIIFDRIKRRIEQLIINNEVIPIGKYYYFFSGAQPYGYVEVEIKLRTYVASADQLQVDEVMLREL
jgi:hypothetical protein